MTNGVVVPFWPDRPPLEAMDVALAAAAAGCDELWVGEMATFDAFALAAAIAVRTETMSLTVGPLAVSVRDPVSLALGVASVSALGGRPAGLALGASTPVVASAWHGRDWSRPAARLRETATAVRPLLAGEKSDFRGDLVRTEGFRLRIGTSATVLTIAAFGARSIQVAAELADRLVVNLVTVDQVAQLRQQLDEHAGSRPERPRLAAWVVAAVDPSSETLDQVKRAVVPYLAAPGYGEMFIRAGFGELVGEARAGIHPRQLFAAVPTELVECVAAIGAPAHVSARLAAYRAAGVDDISIVPATADDPGGSRTIECVLSGGRAPRSV